MEKNAAMQQANTESIAKRIGLKVSGWEQTSKGPALVVECPGIDEHTTTDGYRDACIFPGPPPTLKCVHESCSDSVARVNEAIRRIGHRRTGKSVGVRRSSPRSRKTTRKSISRHSQAASELLEVAKSTNWTISDVIASSPSTLSSDPMEHFRSHLELFRKHHGDGEIWSGFKYQSGKEEHRDNFRTFDSWLNFYNTVESHDALPMPFPLITPGIFAKGVVRRADKNIVMQPWLVIEHDDCEKNEQVVLARFIETHFELRLRAVVDTRGKSLHFWFDRPEPPIAKTICMLLDSWGFDPSAHRGIAQPMRVAGAFRPPSDDPLDFDSRLQFDPDFIQRLIYLDLDD